MGSAEVASHGILLFRSVSWDPAEGRGHLGYFLVTILVDGSHKMNIDRKSVV